MISLAVLYIAQDALFLGVVQVVVYTGAVMMLFLFVLMLIGVDSSESLVETIRGQRIAAIVAGWASASCSSPASATCRWPASPASPQANAGGNVEGLAALIFTRYLWAFELTSALLITAALGAMVLAHRERFERAQDPARTGRGTVPARRPPDPMPNPACSPGTTPSTSPARLPDGSGSELSVSAILHRRQRRIRTPTCTAEGRPMNPDNYLYLSALLFTIGAAGVLLRRNAIVMFMCVELMLNAANLAFVTFSRMHGHLDGQVVAFFTMVVAACEVVVGLAIIMTIFRTRRSASVDDASLLKN